MAAPTLAPGLARKVKKILDTKVDSPELLASFGTLAEVHPENSASARRGLRATVERRGLAIHQEFLAGAAAVVDALAGVQAELDALGAACDGIEAGLEASKASTAGLLGETGALAASLGASQRRSGLVQEFLGSYQLAPEEVAALEGGDIGPDFFAALSRVRAIHANCRALLHTHHQRAGLEIMDAMGGHQEGAYERLCRWVQGQCRALASDDAPEVDDTLRTAAAALQQRPVLFKYCAEEVATTRHNALFQRFIAALTRGGPGGMPRPIEMHAHEPQRYIGDMLAWVHQSLASEHELLVSLFGAGEEGQQETRGDMPSTALLLDRVFESICRPLKVRIEQVLMSAPSLLLCFRLSNLLAFYSATMSAILGEEGQLVETLRGCKEMASRIFFEQLKAKGDQLQRYPPAPPRDLSPPPQVSETVRQLLEIIEIFDTGMEQHSPEAADSELDKVLTAGLEPLLSMCDKSSEALSANAPSRVDEGKHLDPSAQRVYLINCLHAIQTLLGRRTFMERWIAKLAELMEAHMAALVGGEAGVLLSRVGMAEVLDRMRIFQEGGGAASAMAEEPALALDKVAAAMKALFAAVSELDALPGFSSLQAPRLRAEASGRVAKLLADAYGSVYEALGQPSNGYAADGNISAHVKHTPAQVATILGTS